MAEHLGLYCGAAFVLQLLFSFLRGKLWIRLIPIFGIIGCMTVSMLSFFLVGEAFYLLYYMGWGAVLFSAGAAWIVRALARMVRSGK